MISKHLNCNFGNVDQRKTEQKLAFRTTENKEKDNFQLDQSNFKPDVVVFVPGASVNKSVVGNAEIHGISLAQTVQETVMHKPAIESKTKRLSPKTAHLAVSYQDVLCSLLVQQSQCLQRHNLPDLKLQTFKGDPL